MPRYTGYDWTADPLAQDPFTNWQQRRTKGPQGAIPGGGPIPAGPLGPTPATTPPLGAVPAVTGPTGVTGPVGGVAAKFAARFPTGVYDPNLNFGQNVSGAVHARNALRRTPTGVTGPAG